MIRKQKNDDDNNNKRTEIELRQLKCNSVAVS